MPSRKRKRNLAREMDTTAVLGYSQVKILNVPATSRMSFRFAGLDDKTDEEILMMAELRREVVEEEGDTVSRTGGS